MNKESPEYQRAKIKITQDIRHGYSPENIAEQILTTTKEIAVLADDQSLALSFKLPNNGLCEDDLFWAGWRKVV